MKVTKGGNYLKGDNVRDGDSIKFLDEGEIQTSDTFKYKDGNPVKSLVFKVEYKGEEKQMKVTMQSKVALIDAWGDETKGWIGKIATIFVFPTPDGTKKTIVLKPLQTVKPEDVKWEP